MEGLNPTGGFFALALLAALIAARLWRQSSPKPAPDELQALPPLPTLPQRHWLSEEQHARWQLQTARLLREKRFIACAGMQLTESHCHTIARMACLLRLQTGAEQQALFPSVHEVLVYPQAFLAPPMRESLSDQGLELVDDTPDERIGEHAPGQVVLSWADVEAAIEGDSVNIVVHEFAHALDSENLATEGAPPMADYREWSVVMAAEFARLRRHRRPPVLDPYGAQSPAEFWCVVAEAFFQQPAALEKHHARVYQLLTAYFEIAPPSRIAPDRPAA